MGTNQATPDLMHSLAGGLDARAGAVESWGNAAAGLCQSHGYWTAATGVAGSTFGSAEWARGWAASLEDRAALLEQYDAFVELGSSYAGGAGAALGAARAWALSAPDLEFNEWYRRTIGAALQRQRETRMGERLAEEWRKKLLDDPEGFVSRLVALSPVAAAAFFESLGHDETVEVLQWTTPPLGDPYFVPGDLGEAFAVSLGRAWDSGALDERWKDEFIAGTYDWDLLYHAGLLGRMSGDYWGRLAARIIGEGPRTDLARNPSNSMYTYGSEIDRLREILETDPEAAKAFVTSPELYMNRGLEDEWPVEAWIDDLLRTELSRLDEATYVEVVGRMLLTVASLGGDVRNTTMETRLIDAVLGRELQAASRTYLTGALVQAAGSGGVPEALVPTLAEAIVAEADLVFDAITGYDHLAVGLFPHPGGGPSLQLTESEVEGALRLVAENDEAMEVLMEDLQQYFADRIAMVDDATALSQLGRDIGSVSGALVTAINTADISDATAIDERRGAVVGMIGILVAAVPVPGFGLVSTGMQGAGRRIIAASYADMKRRGLALLETSKEGAARVEADAFRELFVDEMAALLIVGSLSAEGALAATIEDFASTHPNATDFALDDTITLTTPEQQHSFNEFLQWVVASHPQLNLAVLGLVTEFSGELPTWNN